MNTIGDRIKEIRKINGITQQRFADELGLKRNTVGGYEIGTVTPSDRTVSDICRVFGICEDWLRYGLEPMKADKPREEEIAELVGSALTGSNEFKRAVVQMICSRTEEELQILEASLRAIYEQIKNE